MHERGICRNQCDEIAITNRGEWHAVYSVKIVAVKLMRTLDTPGVRIY